MNRLQELTRVNIGYNIPAVQLGAGSIVAHGTHLLGGLCGPWLTIELYDSSWLIDLDLPHGNMVLTDILH
jgi:hypothetical protein